MDKEHILVFENKDLGKIRTVMIDGVPWFVGKDVATILGYSNTKKALLDHVDSEDKTDGVTIRDPIGREQKPVFINESGLYSLILSSRMPLAKQFKRWVTAEVLPSIRKYGAYMMPSLLGQVKENPQVIYGLAEKLLTEKNRADWLQSELSRAKPKADYYDAFVNPRDCTNIRSTANELGIRQCELTAWLVAQRFLYRDYGGQLLPYSPHLRKGLFIERDFVRNGHKGVQTLFTPYGKEMVRQMLMEAGYLPLY